MNDIGEQLLAKLRSSLPGSIVYWEKEPTAGGLHGSVLSAEYQHRKFTMQFASAAETVTVHHPGHEPASATNPSGKTPVTVAGQAEVLDDTFIEQVVDDFTDFFSRTIYPKEKFTRII